MRKLLLLALLFSSQNCFAEAFQNVGTAKNHTDTIMAKVAEGDVEGGLKLIKPYSIVPPAEFDAMLGQTVLQLPAMTQRFGKAVGMEFIRQDKVGESLVRLIYIGKYERHATRWNFYLYKGPGGWVINTFTFDDQFQHLFPH